MKTFATFAIALGLIFSVSPLRSQTDAAKATPEEQLKTMKEQNQKLLDQQAASLQKLDDILKDAQQLRTFAHRT